MKSVCIVAYTNYSTDARVIRVAESAYDAGFKVFAFALKEKTKPVKELVNNVFLYRLPIYKYYGQNIFKYTISYLSFFSLCFFHISKHHFRKKFTIIYVNNMPDFLVFSTILCRLIGAKIVLDIHDTMPDIYLAKFIDKKEGLFFNILKLQERLSALYSNWVVTVHDKIKEDILTKNGINQKKITVIANFADGRLFKPVEFYSIDAPLRLLYYGTISKRFDLENIVQCIASLKAKDGIYLKIIGKGDSQISLKKCIARLGLEKNVHYDENTYSLKEIAEIIKHYHLGLVPYRLSKATNYMLPVKMLELTAAGIPVITISNIAIKSYFESTMYFQYDPLDMHSLTKLFEELINNPELLLSKREEILKRRDDFLWQNEYIKLASLLRKLSERGHNEQS